MDLFGEPGDSTISDSVGAEIQSMSLSSDGGLVSPKAMKVCFGHDSIEQKLLTMINKGRLPHALIFSGDKGIGKATMAFRLAKFLFSHTFDEKNVQSLNSADNHTAVRQVISGAHPDFMLIEREYDSSKNTYKSHLSVSEIRKIPGFLRMTAASGGWRVVMIDDADTMNRNAQNALLKVLEEPPQNTLIILVCHRLGTMIPTIRSRAGVLTFQSLSKDDLKTIIDMSDYDISEDDFYDLDLMCEGSPGKAIGYLDQQGLDVLNDVTTHLSVYPEFDWAALHQYAESIGRKGGEQSYRMFQDTCLWFFTNLIRTRVRSLGEKGRQTASFTNLSLERIVKICDSLKAHFIQIEHSNLDRRQGVLGAFHIIQDC